jgi:hypothetical protein
MLQGEFDPRKRSLDLRATRQVFLPMGVILVEINYV